MSVKVFARHLNVFTLLLIVSGCVEEASVRFMAADVHSSDARVASGTPPVSSALPTSATSLLKLHFINVGQGDCTLVKCPNGEAILVDCGSIKDGNAGQVRDYLLEQLDADNPRIDLLVVSHPDQDHYNFLPDVLSDVEIEKMILVGEASEHSKGGFVDWFENEVYAEAWILEKSHFDPADRPSEFCECGEADVFVLAANIEATRSPKNARSIVLMVRYGDFEVILTGDATRDTEKKILERYKEAPAWLDVDVLKIGHHGSSATSTSSKWAKALQPKLAVVSAAFYSQFKHPREKVITRVAKYTAEADPHSMRWGERISGEIRWQNKPEYSEAIYSTATNGTILVTTNGSWYEVTYSE